MTRLSSLDLDLGFDSKSRVHDLWRELSSRSSACGHSQQSLDRDLQTAWFESSAEDGETRAFKVLLRKSAQQWNQMGLQTSISHSQILSSNLGVAVGTSVIDSRTIGVDLESTDRVQLPTVLRICKTFSERNRVSESLNVKMGISAGTLSASQVRQQILAALWVSKEAAFKAVSNRHQGQLPRVLSDLEFQAIECRSEFSFNLELTFKFIKVEVATKSFQALPPRGFETGFVTLGLALARAR